MYSFRFTKGAILVFLEQISGGVKDSNSLVCWPHAVSFDMQIIYDHLIRQVIRSIF
jgi:hypothetical protein